ncbi:MAG: hypothetical protein ACREON_03955, partial [Gemmatimonadaceae bacterium]
MSRRRTITEREVRRAAREGARSLDVRDAVVTPSARDAARQLDVQLVSGGREGTGSARARGADSPPPLAARAALAIAVGADHG